MISDNVVRWDDYKKGDIICEQFSRYDWHKAVQDIDNDLEWAEFVSAHPDYISCYILRKCGTEEDIAFVYILHEYDSDDIISIHGGGWSQPLLYYRGYILIIRTLLERGYKVRTYCDLANVAAIRFSRSVGFIPYRYTDSQVLMWISKKTLKRTSLYRRFYPESV